MQRLMLIAAALTITGAASIASNEKFRLVHAIGNSEKVIAKRLSKSECEIRKKDYATVAIALSGGSVTCLPERIFER